MTRVKASRPALTWRSLLDLHRYIARSRAARDDLDWDAPCACSYLERHCRAYGIDNRLSPTSTDAWVRMALTHRGIV